VIWRRAIALLAVVAVTTGAGFGVVGDSVTYDAKDELEARGATVLAHGGVDIVQGRPAIRRFVREGRRRIVIALGLMDVGYRSTEEELRTRVRAVMRDDLSGVPCPFWVDLKTSAAQPHWEERAEQFNEILGEMGARYGVRVIHWSVFAQGHPGWFRRDGIHLRPEGQRAYARFLDLAVDRHC
jgi:hypothetical protein